MNRPAKAGLNASKKPLPFRHCGAGVRWTPLRSRSTDRAGRRDRRKVRGNPHPPCHCEGL